MRLQDCSNTNLEFAPEIRIGSVLASSPRLSADDFKKLSRSHRILEQNSCMQTQRHRASAVKLGEHECVSAFAAGYSCCIVVTMMLSKKKSVAP